MEEPPRSDSTFVPEADLEHVRPSSTNISSDWRNRRSHAPKRALSRRARHPVRLHGRVSPSPRSSPHQAMRSQASKHFSKKAFLASNCEVIEFKGNRDED
jgi:hypothetical protein